MRAFKLVAVLILFLSLALTVPAYSASLSLGLATNKQTFNVTDTVQFLGSVSNGSAVPDALVFFEVDTPKGNPWIVRTFTTGQTPSPPLGKWIVELLNVTPCDSSGTPQSSFSAGGSAGFDLAIRNNGLETEQVVVVLNAYYSNGVPFLLMTPINVTLQGGQTVGSLTWPVEIPVTAVSGQATVYASVFSDFPKNNGLPFSPEKSAVFNITSVNHGGTHPPSSSPLGSFNLTVPLTSIPLWLGNYTVFAITHYGPSIATNQTVFTVKLIGDLNHDGKIDMRDIAIVARAFNTVPGDHLWNAAADLSGPTPGTPDGRVDMRDVSYVAREFGIVAIP